MHADLDKNNRFIITSLPRCGSTTLARVLNCHPNINCLIEPFHPRRYQGQFHALAVDNFTFKTTLDLIWKKWNGIKHVWEASGWPFLHAPVLNDNMLLGSHKRIIFLSRRNLLRRFISNYICRHTRYWIGTKKEFQVHFDKCQLPTLDPTLTRAQIKRDFHSITQKLQFLKNHDVPALILNYEDIYRTDASVKDRVDFINSILTFLEFSPIDIELFTNDWQACFDSDSNQWASTEIYLRIPGIERIEREVGSDETGWIFK